jgi:hypothetical protein
MINQPGIADEDKSKLYAIPGGVGKSRAETGNHVSRSIYLYSPAISNKYFQPN